MLSHFTVEQLAACHSRYPDPSSQAPELIGRGHRGTELTAIEDYSDVLNDNMIAA